MLHFFLMKASLTRLIIYLARQDAHYHILLEVTSSSKFQHNTKVYSQPYSTYPITQFKNYMEPETTFPVLAKKLSCSGPE